MNFYNQFPYSYPMYYQVPNTINRTSLFRRIIPNGINFKNILNGAQKTINVVNQTLPLIDRAKPIVNNAKTMFKVMHEFKKVNTPIKTMNNKKDIQNNIIKEPTKFQAGPTFFQ